MRFSLYLLLISFPAFPVHPFLCPDHCQQRIQLAGYDVSQGKQTKIVTVLLLLDQKIPHSFLQSPLMLSEHFGWRFFASEKPLHVYTIVAVFLGKEQKLILVGRFFPVVNKAHGYQNILLRCLVRFYVAIPQENEVNVTVSGPAWCFFDLGNFCRAVGLLHSHHSSLVFATTTCAAQPSSFIVTSDNMSIMNHQQEWGYW